MGIEDEIKKTSQIPLKSNFIKVGGLEHCLDRIPICSRQVRLGAGIGHEVHFFACAILTSHIENQGNLALLEKNIPLRFWPLSAE